MKTLIRRLAIGAVGLTALPLLVGCGAAVGTLEPHRFAKLPANHTEATVYYPKGDVTESVLMMRTSGPKTVRAGERFEYKIELYNPTDQTIVKDIVISDRLSPEFELVSSTPRWADLNRFEPKEKLLAELREPETDLDDVRKATPAMLKGRFVSIESPHEAERVRWYIEELYPEKLVTIRVRGKARSEGHWKSCASASYDLSACMAAKIVSPELELVADLDREFILCQQDQADLRMRVRNSGSGKTEDVTVTARLPQGMSHNGSQTITERVGKLPAGQSETITRAVHVDRPGKYVVQATAKSRSGLSSDAGAVTLTAREAELEVEALGPEDSYVGVPIEYELRVRNIGNAPARDVVIESSVPSAAAFVDATHNGRLVDGAVRWRLDELPAGKYVPVTVRFEGEDDGYVRNVVTARSACSADVTAIARTRLEGIATMVVEVVDTQDPIRVGNDEIYEIRVHNQGSAPETNVLVRCRLPEGQEFVSARGTTDLRSGSREVVFQPVRTLAADETARWNVKTRGTRTGDMRFQVTVDSDQHGRPVRETEATRVFD